MMFKSILALLLTIAATAAQAHDTWVETNTNLVRVGDAVHVDLKLGNHGNDHRDFKLAGKPDLRDCQLTVMGPEGEAYDLKPELSDIGYAPKEGYWTAKFATASPGMYLVAQSQDQVMHYAPVRLIRSAKTCFVASESLDRVSTEHPGFDQVLGHALEIVPIANPVTPMGPGQSIRVRLLLHGKPLSNTSVAFIPRGHSLREGTDSDYERTTDADGQASFTPTAGNVYLVVAHHLAPQEAGEGYESTKYAATLTVFVPEICPCCGE